MHRNRDLQGVLRSFLDIGVQLTNNLDIDQVLLTIVQRSMELTGARYGAALTLDSAGNLDKFLHRGMTPEQVAELPHPPRGEGLIGHIVSQRETVRCASIEDHPASVGYPYEHADMKAFLGVPLQERGEMVGALYLTKEAAQGPFSEADEDTVAALGALAAVGILNARLFQAEAERARNSDLLQSLASRIRRSLDTGQVLEAAVEELGRAAGASRCYIRLSDPPGHATLGAIEYVWSEPGSPRIIDDPDRHYPIASMAAMTRMTQWSNDIEHDERLDGADVPGSREDLLAIGARAALASPLEWGDELLGVVVFHCTQPRRWSEADIELIEGAAGEVATALHHADLYARAVETADELARLDELRRDFVSMVSHELRSPMTVVAGISDLLQKRFDQMSTENRKDLIDTLGREARRLTKLVSEVLDVESIDQGLVSLIPAKVDVALLVQESIQDAGGADRTRLVLAETDTTVVADRDRIKQVMLNLLSNAVKFSPEGAQVSVEVVPEEDGVRVSVTDQGPGMTEEEVGRLFQRFTRIARTGNSQPGSGLGLYLSKALVEKHGGRIWVDTKPGAGSTFSFWLPRNAAGLPA
ncbi:MAG: GAF domain-containing protein [Actinomycetota bacterium]|nr:GAF domain-containing protein [Actinomycetota bacterium]